LAEESTAKAKELGTAVKLKLRAMTDDRFEYDFYLNTSRHSQAVDGGDVIGSSARTDNWIAQAQVLLKEDEIAGSKDLRASFVFDSLQFEFNDGQQGFAGFIGQGRGQGKDKQETGFVSRRGAERNSVVNIPGWPGVAASEVNRLRGTQAISPAGNMSFNVAETGRVYAETYFADFDGPDQRCYPARLIDPLQLVLYMWPEFAADASVKVGDTIIARRRFPVGVLTGETVMYEFSYKLEKTYGKAEEPTAALFSFTAKPVSANAVTQRLRGLDTSVTPGEIKGGTLLLDQVKGVPVNVNFKFGVTGKVSEPGSANNMDFAADVEFSSSLRKPQEAKK